MCGPGVGLDQQLHALDVGAEGRLVERRVLLLARQVDVRAAEQQEPRALGLPVGGGPCERRVALVVDGVDGDAGVEQQARALGVAARAGNVEWRVPERVALARVRARVEEAADDPGAALDEEVVEQRAPRDRPGAPRTAHRVSSGEGAQGLHKVWVVHGVCGPAPHVTWSMPTPDSKRRRMPSIIARPLAPPSAPSLLGWRARALLSGG